MIKLSRPQTLGLLVATAVLIAAGFAASKNGVAAAENAADTSKAAKAALTVSATQAMPGDWPLTLSANGNVTAWQEAIIGAEANGLRIEEVLVNVGDHVRKGQLLARLQGDTLAAELEQAKAGLQEALATQAEAAANAERARQLKASGAMSAQQINQLLTGENTAGARVAVIKAQIKASEIRLAQTRIMAPDDGTISARMATLGAVVSPGQELFRLIRRDRLEWRAEIPSADLPKIKPGLPVTIYTASGTPITGSVRMLAPTVDAQTRNGLVYVDLTASGGATDARPGMFARGEFQLGRSGALTLPQSAVQLRDGFHDVYRIGENNKLTQTKVDVGRREGNRIEITSGLTAGQRVVESGVGFLADGDTVRVVDTPVVPPPAGDKAMTDKKS